MRPSAKWRPRRLSQVEISADDPLGAERLLHEIELASTAISASVGLSRFETRAIRQSRARTQTVRGRTGGEPARARCPRARRGTVSPPWYGWT
jgi:hypothetical protein